MPRAAHAVADAAADTNVNACGAARVLAVPYVPRGHRGSAAPHDVMRSMGCFTTRGMHIQAAPLFQRHAMQGVPPFQAGSACLSGVCVNVRCCCAAAARHIKHG